jgi:hypothetical protein
MAGAPGAGTARKGTGDEPEVSPTELWVARARGAGAVLGFLIAFWVCRREGLETTDAILRGLVGAVALALVSWWSALMVLTALVRAAAAQARREPPPGVDDAA